MTKFTAYAALQPKSKLQLWEYEPAPLKDSEIEVRVTHNGLCHTDIHMRDNDWGVSQFPLVAEEVLTSRSKELVKSFIDSEVPH